MHQQFDLYVSGIRLGRFALQNGCILHSALAADGAEAPFAPLDAAADAAYRLHANFAPGEVLSALDTFTRALAPLPQTAQVNGREYEQAAPGSFLQRHAKYPVDIRLQNGQIVAFLCPSRESIAVLVRAGFESSTPLARWGSLLSAPLCAVTALPAQPVPMRDGVCLSTLVLLPAPLQKPVSAILVRTPYTKEVGIEKYWRFVRRGFAVVVQDVRGKGASEGEWIPHYYEVEDGSDTLDWIAAQSWSNGRAGTFGGSYLGYVQWCAAASGNPHLKAMVSIVTSGSSFTDIVRRGGGWGSGTMAWNFSVSGQKFDPSLMERTDWDEVLDIRPLSRLDEQALGRPIPFWHAMLSHQDEDDFWAMSDWSRRFAGRPVPAFIQSGWYDDNGMGTTEALRLTAAWPQRRVLLGPWQHSGNSTYDLHARSFPAQAIRWDIDLLHLQWFLHHLDNAAPAPAYGVEYYRTGQNAWHTAAHWPPRAARSAFFAAGPGGSLAQKIPAQPGKESYLYDPAHLALQLIDVSENELAVPADYAEQNRRPDVLSFATAPLSAPLTLVGDALVTLYVESTAPDTDFIVRLCDSSPDGRSISLADGVLRARYKGGFDHAEWLAPGHVARLRICTTKFSHTLLPGHRLLLTVTSSAKNMIFPHPNTREAEQGTEVRTALNTVHFGPDSPTGVQLWLE